MKRLCAILALVGLVLIVPLSALAVNPPSEPEQQEQGDVQGIYAPPAQGRDDSVPENEQENQGDPDELGGGFRGNGAPPTLTGPTDPGFWLDPVVVLIMNLV